MTTQNYICPNCQGKGCPLCQNKGQLTLTEQEVSELQKVMTKNAPQFQGQATPDYGGFYPNHEERQIKSQVAGFLTLFLLALVTLSGFLSWFFSHTFKPFFQFWSIVIALIILKPVTSLKFFREEPIHDFLSAIENDGIKIRKSPFYPFL